MMDATQFQFYPQQYDSRRIEHSLKTSVLSVIVVTISDMITYSIFISFYLSLST